MHDEILTDYKIEPDFDTSLSPKHVAIIMDGNGRWANAQNLPRTQGHIAGEEALMRAIAGAIQCGVKYLSVYAFSTENWKRSPSEVKFLMGYSRDVLRKRCDQLNEWGVKIVWSGRRPKLWKSVINELERAQKITEKNTVLTLQMCINYGGQLEITDAVNNILQDKEKGIIKGKITEKTFEKYLYNPNIPPVDLMIRTSGEKRLSNFLLWQCAYAEFDFIDIHWPEMTQEILCETIKRYLNRDRRFGGAIDKVNKK